VRQIKINTCSLCLRVVNLYTIQMSKPNQMQLNKYVGQLCNPLVTSVVRARISRRRLRDHLLVNRAPCNFSGILEPCRSRRSRGNKLDRAPEKSTSISCQKCRGDASPPLEDAHTPKLYVCELSVYLRCSILASAVSITSELLSLSV
jgi:hypothetical protein